jgi:hypothetical protein
MKRSILIFPLILSLFILVTPLALAQGEETGQIYVVQVNDTLWKLAEKYLGNGHFYPTIVEATNNMAAEKPTIALITDPNLIIPRQQLWIPALDASAVTSAQATPPAQPAPTTARPPTKVGEPGGHIAFSFWNNHSGRCTYEINIVSVPDCLQGPTQCQAARRIFALNNISEPALSPDGTRLAFRGWGEPPSEDNPYIDCAPAHPYRHLGHSNLDGTNFVSISAYWEDSHPDWSPDGNRLIFDSNRVGDGLTRIYAASADGLYEEDMFLAGQHPSWAPDSNRFVYRGCDMTGNRCGLWTAVAFEPKSWEAGANLLAPVIRGDQVAHPDWSPTREEIVYQRLENGVWNLWLVNVDGRNDRPLTNSPNLQGLPDWSPDGNWVAYLTHDGQNWSIRIINREGTDDRHIFTYDGGIYVIPRIVEPYYQRDWIDEQISWSQ